MYLKQVDDLKQVLGAEKQNQVKNTVNKPFKIGNGIRNLLVKNANLS